MDDYLRYQCDEHDEPFWCSNCETYYFNKCDCNQFVKFFREKKDDFFALFEKKDPEAPF